MTPKQCYITSCPPGKIHLSMLEGDASIILNNWTQIALGRYKKLWEEKPAFRHSLSYRSRDSDRSRGASHFSLLCSSLLPNLYFPFHFPLCVKDQPHDPFNCSFPASFHCPEFKMTNSHCLLGDEVHSLVQVGSGTSRGWVGMQM